MNNNNNSKLCEDLIDITKYINEKKVINNQYKLLNDEYIKIQQVYKQNNESINIINKNNINKNENIFKIKDYEKRINDIKEDKIKLIKEITNINSLIDDYQVYV